MTAAEYREAAARIVTRDPLTGPVSEAAFRRAEILAQLAVSAATSELAAATATATAAVQGWARSETV